MSSLEPHTHVLIALNSSKHEHLAALHAAVRTGHVVITTKEYFDAMPDDGPLDLEPSALLALRVPTEPIQQFLARGR